MTQRQFVKGGVAAFTVTFAAPAFLSRSGARAGRARAATWSCSYLERRQRRAQHARALQRSVLLQPPADAGGAGGAGAADRHRLRGVALGLHPRLTGLQHIFDQGRLALIQRTGYANSEPLALQRHRHLVHRQPGEQPGARLGRSLSRYAARRRSIRWSAWNTTGDTAARAAGVARGGCRRSRAVRAMRFQSPNSGSGGEPSAAAAARIASHVPVDQPQLAFVTATLAGRARHARPRGVGRPATRRASTYPTNGFGQALQAVAGAMAKGIGTQVFYVRPAASTRTPRRTSTSDARRLLQADGDAERRAARLLHRPEESGAARRHARPLVLRVRPPHHRERQQGHRPRRRERDAGDGRHGARRPLRHGALAQHRTRRTRRSRTAPATSTTRPTSDPSTRRCSTTGSAPIRRRCWAAISGRSAPAFV